ncbi:hypothetical protein [Sphingomonas lenta]|uniref:Uncharacterized protein n=1 Tax=Sphingomonas lenta TaxID=1141887 RepID=A0A2A2SCT2_9SPHN|nr:hypothetical protein [Sphingomonas lenta]PAX07023.1 hypothetical protein CKY28_13275 [Sphingomonas lenta]
MRKPLIVLTLMSALAPSAPAWATTVTVHNRSQQPLRLAVDKPLSGYEQPLSASVEPGFLALTRKPNGKVLMPHAEADGAAFSVRYVDERGAGCRFSVTPVRHSGAYARAVPVAEPIGDGRCEAATGSTIGDFVFTVR